MGKLTPKGDGEYEEEISLEEFVEQYKALQARVKDQAETIVVQKAIYETLSGKVKGLEADLKLNKEMLAKQCDRAMELETENARLQRLVDMSQRVVDAVRTARWHPRSAVGVALRELDGATTDVSSK